MLVHDPIAPTDSLIVQRSTAQQRRAANAADVGRMQGASGSTSVQLARQQQAGPGSAPRAAARPPPDARQSGRQQRQCREGGVRQRSRRRPRPRQHPRSRETWPTGFRSPDCDNKAREWMCAMTRTEGGGTPYTLGSRSSTTCMPTLQGMRSLLRWSVSLPGSTLIQTQIIRFTSVSSNFPRHDHLLFLRYPARISVCFFTHEVERRDDVRA